MTYVQTTAQINPAEYDLDRIIRIITASVLGDGGLQLQEDCKNARFQTAKTIGHSDYLGWIRSVVELIAPTVTYTVSERMYAINGLVGWTKAHDVVQSRVHPILTGLRETYYRDRKKVVPQDLKLDLEMIAILLSDDGSRSKLDGRIRICTDGFDYDSVKVLHEQFVAVTGLPWKIVKGQVLKDGSQAYRLHLSRRHAEDLAIQLKPFMFPSFYYKLGL